MPSDYVYLRVRASDKLHEECGDWIPSRGTRGKDITDAVEQAIELVKRAAEDSCLSMEDGPGCFFCDREKHTKRCPAAKVLAAFEGGTDGK